MSVDLKDLWYKSKYIWKFAQNRSIMSKSYNRITRGFAGLFSLSTALLGTDAFADGTKFNAQSVMESLPAEGRVPYMLGVIEGLAYARYMRDDKKTEGMDCIYDWFLKNKNAADVVFNAFGQFPQYTPGAIIGALVQKKCGA